MARIQTDSWPVLPADELSRPVVFVVDMINGFIKEGALADPGIQACLAPLVTLLEELKLPAVFIRDAHDPQAREFEAFPVHCLRGDTESEIVSELQKYADCIVEKNSTNAFLAPEFQKLLPELEMYEDWIVTGCCTDICVMQFALCLQGWLNQNNLKGRRVIVPVSCVDTYEAPGHNAKSYNESAFSLMELAGIHVVSRIALENEKEKVI